MHSATHPYSPLFTEHYWSGGAAEKTHVYLEGNRLPVRFAPAQRFTVAELGFGTALNFLLTASLWNRLAPAGARLTYISYELHPFALANLRPIHAAFPSGLQALSTSLLDKYAPVPGWQELHLGAGVTLHLYVGDAASGINSHPRLADAWFLDGFSPARNPAMWDAALLQAVGRHTAAGGTASTYSVAASVRRGLAVAGFAVRKAAGFPPKAEMLEATLLP